MSDSILFVPGMDSFERAEFDAAALVDTKAVKGNPKLTYRTNAGQSLVFELTDKASFYDQLAQWAVEVAAALRATGR